jgi:hypothetical protein
MTSHAIRMELEDRNQLVTFKQYNGSGYNIKIDKKLSVQVRNSFYFLML